MTTRPAQTLHLRAARTSPNGRRPAHPVCRHVAHGHSQHQQRNGLAAHASARPRPRDHGNGRSDRGGSRGDAPPEGRLRAHRRAGRLVRQVRTVPRERRDLLRGVHDADVRRSRSCRRHADAGRLLHALRRRPALRLQNVRGHGRVSRGAVAVRRSHALFHRCALSPGGPGQDRRSRRRRRAGPPRREVRASDGRAPRCIHQFGGQDR